MRSMCWTGAVIAIAAVAGAAALGAQDRVDLAMVARIHAEATQRSKVLETFNYITNVIGARPTGSRGTQTGGRLRAGEAHRMGAREPAPRTVPVRPRMGTAEVLSWS